MEIQELVPAVNDIDNLLDELEEATQDVQVSHESGMVDKEEVVDEPMQEDDEKSHSSQPNVEVAAKDEESPRSQVSIPVENLSPKNGE